MDDEQKKPVKPTPKTTSSAKKSAKPTPAKAVVKKATPTKTESNSTDSTVMPATAPENESAPKTEATRAVVRRSVGTALAISVALVTIFLVVFGVLIYKYQSNSRVVQVVASIIPYPAEKVNGSFVSYSKYLFEVNSIKHYYLSQTGSDGKKAIDFTTKDGKDKLKQLETQVLGQLKQEAVVRQLASKYKVRVTNKEVETQVDQIVKSAGGTDKVKEVLKKFYGWDMSDLKRKVSYQLLTQKVTAKVNSDASLNTQVKAKADKVLKEIKAGGDFAALAKKYSQDSSAASGGDLGFIAKGQTVKEFEDAAFALQPDQTSGLVKSKFGYHVIKLIEKKDNTVHVAHILIKTVDFANYIQTQTKAAKVSEYIKPK